MKIIVYPAGALQSNCYIIYNEESLEGVIVDAGDDGDKIIDLCKQNRLDIKYIILTHGHFDHIGAVQDVKLATGAAVLMNRKDEFLISDPPKELKLFHKGIKAFEVDRYLEDGDKILLNGLEFEVLATPGHTPGGICLKIENRIFSGDTLFKDAIGRTDFAYGDFAELIASIKTKLFVLEDNMLVYPGHEEATTIGHEKRYNNYIFE